MSPLRARWTGEVLASVLPLMCAPTLVCVTCSGPNSSFEVCTHKSVSTGTGDIWPQFKARGSLREGGELNRHRQTDRQTDWYWTLAPIDDTQSASSPSASSVVFRTQACAILFILLLVSYLVPKLINVPTSALLHLVDAFISTPTFISTPELSVQMIVTVPGLFLHCFKGCTENTLLDWV